MAMSVRKADYEKFRIEADAVKELMTREWYQINPDANPNQTRLMEE